MKKDEIMNTEQLNRMHRGKGFIAALDQSGGSTPKALEGYGIHAGDYSGDEQMFDRVHEMRSRVMTSPVFTSEHILGVILFENTMDRTIDDMPTSDYLWNRKGIVPFLKVDKGMEPASDGVQMMKPMPGLDELLRKAVKNNIFGTKMRSVIHDADPQGILALVDQQFEIADRIFRAGLVPIIEPEVDIHSPDKAECEKILKKCVHDHLTNLGADVRVMFKFTIPTEDNFYTDIMTDPHVVRVVALSGGYSRTEADKLLTRNKRLIASFSRALLEDLHVDQTSEQFDAVLEKSIREIYDASIT